MTRTVDDLRPQADLLRSLHRPGDPLVLLNVWDAASARMVERLGVAAIATTSAGVAASLGSCTGGGSTPQPVPTACTR